jgi:hypothetical protein
MATTLLARCCFCGTRIRLRGAETLFRPHCPYCPRPSEIARRAARIRARWSAEETCLRMWSPERAWQATGAPPD